MKKSGRQPQGATKASAAGETMPSSAVTGGGARRRWLAAIAAVVTMAGAVALWQWRAAPPADTVAVPAPASRPAAVAYVADEVCGQCHEKAFAAWSKSHHDEAMMHASESSVRGDFNDASFRSRGETSRFFRRDGRFFVNTAGAEGKLQDFEIKYTFGVDPLQQYLIEFPGGRLQALPIAWDTRRKRWFHLYPDVRHAGDDPLHWTGRYQNWNLMCAECHSTNLRKGYDAKSDAYATHWDLINVSCQSCHGPGEAHVAWANARRDGQPAPAGSGSHYGLLVNYKDGDARHEVDSCGACHSRRQRLADRDLPGAPFLDNFRPALLRAGLYHADGQQLDEVYVYGSMLQSRMHQRGVRCTDCHDAHSLKLKAQGNGVCVQCHSQAGNPRFPTLTLKDYDSPQHHFHKAGTDGAQCVSCHMPVKNYMVVHTRPDHSFRVPRPDLSERLGTPNACNQCHGDKPAKWAAAAVDRWYGPKRERGAAFAEAFAAARAGRRDARPALIAIIRDRENPAIVRATAVELLRDDGAAARVALIEARDDKEGLVRAAAVEALSQLPPGQRVLVLAPALRDPLRLVRIQAARALATVPVDSLAPEDRRAYDAAFTEYMAVQDVFSDMPATQLNLATLHRQRGDLAAAGEHFERTLQMDPYLVQGRTAFASHLSERGDNAAAEQVLREGIRRTPGDGNLHYSLGLLLAETGKTDEMVRELGLGARLLPDNSRATYNHGLALLHTGRRKDAEAVLVKGFERSGDPDIAYALATLYAQDGEWKRALPYAERLLAANPENGQARQVVATIRQNLAAAN